MEFAKYHVHNTACADSQDGDDDGDEDAMGSNERRRVVRSSASTSSDMRSDNQN